MGTGDFIYDNSDIHRSYNAARRLPDETMRLWIDEVCACVGTADAIPVSEPADLLFISMCYHYFQHEMDRVLPKFARVVRPGGSVVIRTSTRDDIEPLRLFDLFPEARDISLQRLPSERTIINALTGETDNGATTGPTETRRFELRTAKRVTQRFAEDRGRYVEKIASRGLSSFRMMSDESFAAGMERLRRHMATAEDVNDLLYEGITLLVFAAR